MAKAIKSVSVLETQLNSLLNRIDFESLDFGATKYDSESNGFVLENTSEYDAIISKIQELKRTLDDSKQNFIASKERESFKQLAQNDDHMKEMLAQYFG